jgi:nucleoside phosphorylase/tetratricopeptide (TPR) repeat protein
MMSSDIALPQATIGIVTALPKEMAAARVVFEPCTPAAGQSGTIYELCAVPCIGGQIVVAMTLLPGYGNEFAAAVTSHMLRDCENVRDVMMVGIAGAIPCPSNPERHVRLGDIIVSGLQGVFQFDFGKQEQGKPFQHRHTATRPSLKLWNAVNRLLTLQESGERPWEKYIDRATARVADSHRPPADADVLDDGEGVVAHPQDPNRRDGLPRLFLGAIGSSNILLKDAKKRNEISNAQPDLLCCIEMEGAGVQDATWIGNNAGYLVVRGTCDYGNVKKNDTWQKYAALIAAAFARAVVEALPAPSSSSSEGAAPTADAPVQRQSFGQISSSGNLTIINAQEVHIHIGSSDLALPHMTTISAPLSGSSEPLCVEELQLTDATLDNVRRVESDVRQALEVWDYSRAKRAASTLESLVAMPPERLDDPGMRAAALLAIRSYLNMAEINSSDAASSTARARRLLTLVESKIGPDESSCLAELAAFKASLECIEKGPEAALAQLGDRTDPYAIRTRTALLLNQQKLTEAMQIIEGLEPQERWCDIAVTVYTLNDRVDEAQGIVRWAEGLVNRSRYLQCVVRLAHALMTRVLAGHVDGKYIMPHAIPATKRKELADVLKALRPVLQSIETVGKPVSGLDIAALTVALQANHLLQRREAVVELLKLMEQGVPVPVDVARGVLSGYIEASPDLPNRLRADHPDDFDANILAAIIQSVSFGEHAAAFKKAKELVPFADTDEKKEELFRLLQQMWQNLDDPLVVECETVVGRLAAHNTRLQTIFDASVALRNGDEDLAIAILDGQRYEDDPYWLQLRANALLQKRQLAQSVDFLFQAAKLTNDAGLLNKTGDIAMQSERHDVAAWCYERLVELQPDNLPIRENLTHIYTFVLHDMEKALNHFRVLHTSEPGKNVHTLNLAICLAQLFLPEESLALYDELCLGEDSPIQAVLGRAQLHHSLGNPEAALASLEPFRQRFWEEPPFVLAYLNTAYASGSEKGAKEALQELNALREAGELTPEMFLTVPDKEALEIFKQSFKKTQDLNEQLHKEMLMGRMPWVWAEQVLNNATYWGWRMRTQEMRWILDEPVNRARYCIYSTNGFHARASKSGRRELLPLECPPSGTPIVADVSALITLHRLGLLEAAAEYFGQIEVPAGYLPTVLEDSRQMVLNQRSRQHCIEQITKLIGTSRIQMLAEGSTPASGTPIADEYTDTTEHRYRLADLIQPVHAAGIIKDAELARVSGVNAKPSAVDQTHPALRQFQDVVVALATMETIAHAGVLDAVTGFYRILITAVDRREVFQKLAAIAHQEETRQWHMDLWKRLRNDSRFKFVPHTVPKGVQAKDSEAKDYLPFLASFVAQKSKIPLLADDRVCQVLTLNEAADLPCAAFGSDTLILRLMIDGKVTTERAAEASRLLMSWRYRFLVPPPEILKALADMHRGNLPGQALQEVADYVHECMRDPGLFGGPEKTELGDSMAMRSFLTWVSTIAKFLILIWADEGFSPEVATRLTTWACRELLPSVPRVVEGRMKINTGNITPRLLITHALINASNHFNEPRMADSLKAIKEGLLLDDDAYKRIVTEALNDIVRKEPNA